jgi:ABC-type glutathione transport system ATPase component
MKKNLKWLILAAVLTLIAIFATFGFNSKSQDQHFTAKVERGDTLSVGQRQRSAIAAKLARRSRSHRQLNVTSTLAA